MQTKKLIADPGEPSLTDADLRRVNKVINEIGETRGEVPERLEQQYTALTWSRKWAHNNLTPGLSVGAASLIRGTGTIGCFLKMPYPDSNESYPVGLTNYHVLPYPSEDPFATDKVAQPGWSDLDGWLSHERSRTFLGKTKAGILNSDVDAAVFGLTPHIRVERIRNRLGRWHNLRELPVNPEPSEPEIGDLVLKVGRTTGKTEGQVVGKETIRIRYPKFVSGSDDPHEIDVWTIRPTAGEDNPDNVELSLPGDSGAVWWTVRDNSLVAVLLHVAGEASGIASEERAYGCSMAKVNAAMGTNGLWV